jgi:hypothetical protein
MNYTMEIYPPGDRKTADSVVTSNSPFLACSEGDLLHLPYEGRVVAIEQLLHIFSVSRDGGHPETHKLCVYTCEREYDGG